MNDINALRAYVAQKKLAAARVVGQTLGEVCDRIIDKTPVDTGLAVTNWRPTLDTPSQSSLIERDRSGETARAAVAQVAPHAAGHIFWFVNNTDYADDLEFGKSKQAPLGMVRTSLVEAEAIFHRAIADNR